MKPMYRQRRKGTLTAIKLRLRLSFRGRSMPGKARSVVMIKDAIRSVTQQLGRDNRRVTDSVERLSNSRTVRVRWPDRLGSRPYPWRHWRWHCAGRKFGVNR